MSTRSNGMSQRKFRWSRSNCAGRACLKEIPDHLIIQLKRFDFDLNILQRSKVNDEFHFPTSIDMAPFKFETLNGDDSNSTPDLFELVGILIHSGSAETGHYYSYIKQRPVESGTYSPWVEFNDIDVTGWDPSSLADNCFGGWTESPFPPGMRFPKSWNAYMLFYQRVTDIEVMQAHYQPSGDLPIQLPVTLPLANHITLANELTVRGYLLQDDDHAKFVLYLLKKMRWGVNKTCTNEHQVERRALFFALDHVEQIIVKTEDQPQFEEILYELEGLVRTCARCAWLILEWNAQNQDAIRNVLMRNKREKIRQRFSSLFVSALQILGHSRTPMLSESGPRELPSRRAEYEVQFATFVKTLKTIWGSLYMNVAAWDDYFRILVKLATFGEDEVGMILCEGMFRRCLELILLEDVKPKKNRPYAQLYSRLLERKRRFPYTQVLELTGVLMDNIDLTYGTCFEGGERSQTAEGKWSLALEEDALLRTRASGQSGHLAIVERLVGTHWPHDAVKRILSALLFAESMWGEGQAMSLALSNGMKVDPACDAKNYLEASVLYCTYCSNLNSMRELIKDSASSIESIGNSGGREHAQYLMKLKTVQNEYCPEATIEFFRHNIRLKMADWAPVLLTYPLDATVRGQGEDLVKDLLFDEANFVDDSMDRHTQLIAKQVTKACIDKVTALWVFPRHVPYTAHIEEVVSVIGECCRRFYDQTDKDDAAILGNYQREFLPVPNARSPLA
jgi:ubiquitin carboxyl-terminal hydrolase 34